MAYLQVSSQTAWSIGNFGCAGGSNLLTSFLLEGHAKNAIAYALPVQRVKGGAGLLFIQVHKTEAATAPRHDVRG